MIRAFRFIHAADIHLDSPLRGLAAYEGMPAEILRAAPREAFINLIDAAIREKVDFLVIAGDLTDGDWPDYGTGLFMASQYGRLDKAGIRVFQLRGNHDAAGEATKGVPWPSNVKEFSPKRPEIFQIEELKVALHGQSFQIRDVVDNLAAQYERPLAGYFNIAVLHTALEGNAAHAHYAPCKVAELRASGHQYWALGHVHQHQVIATDPYIVYPGNLQGRHIKEEGPKGAFLVEVGEDQAVRSAERLILDSLRWQRLSVDVSSASTLEAATQAIRADIQTAADAHGESMPLAFRLEIIGATGVDAALRARGGALRADIQAIAAAISEKLWLEKVRVLTTGPTASPTAPQLSADAIAELREILAEAAANAEFKAILESTLGNDLQKVQAVVRDQCEELEMVNTGNFEPLIKQAAISLLARLSLAKA